MAVGLQIVEGDFVINGSGKLNMVEQAQKCARDLGKMLMTSAEFPDNITSYYRYNPLYGTELENRSLYAGLSRSSIRDVVIGLLNKALKNYISIQEGRDNLDLGEIISYVTFDVYYDADDLRNLLIDVKFGTELDNNEISLEQFVQSLE